MAGPGHSEPTAEMDLFVACMPPPEVADCASKSVTSSLCPQCI